MPTSGKSKQPEDTPERAREFFYRDGPFRADEALHNPILDDGDHAAAEAVTRKRLKKQGWDDAKIDRLMGKST